MMILATDVEKNTHIFFPEEKSQLPISNMYTAINYLQEKINMTQIKHNFFFGISNVKC